MSAVQTNLYDQQQELLAPEAIAVLAGVSAETIRSLSSETQHSSTAELPQSIVDRMQMNIERVDPLRVLDIYQLIDILAAEQQDGRTQAEGGAES